MKAKGKLKLVRRRSTPKSILAAQNMKNLRLAKSQKDTLVGSSGQNAMDSISNITCRRIQVVLKL